MLLFFSFFLTLGADRKCASSFKLLLSYICLVWPFLNLDPPHSYSFVEFNRHENTALTPLCHSYKYVDLRQKLQLIIWDASESKHDPRDIVAGKLTNSNKWIPSDSFIKPHKVFGVKGVWGFYRGGKLRRIELCCFLEVSQDYLLGPRKHKGIQS